MLVRSPLRSARGTRLGRAAADNLIAYAFMAGGIACFALFSWYPLVRGVLLSFQQVNFVTDPEWVGLHNFTKLFADPLFWIAWRNTLLFTGLALLLGYALPLLVAVLLNELRHWSGFFRVAVYLPVMLPPIVTVLLWQYFYDPGNGLFNTVLRGLHLPESAWTQSPKTAMISTSSASPYTIF